MASESTEDSPLLLPRNSSPPVTPQTSPSYGALPGAPTLSKFVLPEHVADGAAARPLAHELVLLRLLQRAANTPEELVLTAYELAELGLLRGEILGQLLGSLGVGGEAMQQVVSQALVPMQQHAPIPPGNGTDPASTVSIQSLLGPSGAPNGTFRAHTAAAPYSSPTALSLHSPIERTLPPMLPPGAAASFGLGSFGLRSRLASEWRLLDRLGQGGGGSVRAKETPTGDHLALLPGSDGAWWDLMVAGGI